MVADGVSKVVVRVNSQMTQDSFIFVNGQEEAEKTHTLTEFFKIQPKALGIVQIMTGAMIFFLGVVLTTSGYGYPAILVYSGITYWGSLIYISAGSLSIAAQYKHNLCLMKASLGINVFGAITAGISILLMSIQICILSTMDPSLYIEYFMLRIIGIMLVFTIPQFYISVYISSFACKATCNRDSTVVSVALN
ncbi:membrane-spanning 4-domains subfamily A member 4A-like [Danio aesculapii]|uniref:membrane-spanning 4-domains subfamily A member 4A-like n=1 Tax=Danio aesculapii TaxID=1142201 RepID=UPI0024BF6718|nr:membrane-spanning 4-domains subfamily A member 4A-like [Danio aesculapii]XP_056312928.1 membrane-spanning 4-domains subfamily A member 4A-like [Danio aesculapii]